MADLSDKQMDVLVARVCARIQATGQDGGMETVATVPAPTCAQVVAFADQATEATAQRIYAYIGAHPGCTVAEVVKECGLPKHWFRNPKVLANGERVTPGRALMYERALASGALAQPAVLGSPPNKHTLATPARTDPVQDAAKRAVAVRVALHLEQALDDGLAVGLLYEKAKSTTTLRNMVHMVRERGDVPE